MCKGTTNGEDVYIIKEDIISETILNKLNRGWIHNHGGVPVDMCIGKEVEYLLSQGVVTVGSCCGHGEYQSHVLVNTDELEKVMRLGYKTKEFRWDMHEVFLKTGTQL